MSKNCELYLTPEKKEFFKHIEDFFNAKKDLLYALQGRWEDEYKYEDPEEYKDVIKDVAKEFNLNIYDIKLSYDNQSIKIIFKSNQNIKGYIHIMKTRVKICI